MTKVFARSVLRLGLQGREPLAHLISIRRFNFLEDAQSCLPILPGLRHLPQLVIRQAQIAQAIAFAAAVADLSGDGERLLVNAAESN
jgi:hypothetical protein